ncbi:MAG: DUF1385 domain-containing protein [Nitrospira sp.]|nr:DUF1385 domain-containing protein [bacterium]MBL7050261.1 DUF1385 domain-containing protein [Nitrospira sp.]
MSDVGGQAVIEGVMMRSGNVCSIAVRSPENEIILKTEMVREMPKILKKPVLRGVVALVQSLKIGIRALLYSAEVSGHEEEKPSDMSLVLTVVAAFAIGIGLFIVFPLYATKLMGGLMGSIKTSSLVFNLVDGLLRVLVFFIYIVSISMNKEIQRVFQYHGAEHKAVHAYEAGDELTPENADKYSVLHPRCGTSFLLIVMFMSVLIFSIIPKDWAFIENFLSRLILMPLIAGLSYEFIKYTSRHLDSPFVSMVAWPGMWLQKFTTGTPDHDQLEVAIKALQEVLPAKDTLNKEEELEINVA